jgi:hypothetical protein
VTIAFEKLAPVDLGQAPQPLDVEELQRALQLGEVLLDAGVRELRQGLGSQALDRRSEFAHPSGSFAPNMCSSLPRFACSRSDARHVGDEVR